MPDPRIPGDNPRIPVDLPHHRLPIKQVQDAIEKQLQADYRRRLNVAQLSPEVQAGITSAATSAAERATRANLEAEAFKLAKQFFQPADVNQLIANKLQQAKAGVQLVSKSADLNAILDENAKMLAAKRAALEANKFSPEEAFQLILAEVQGKASRRGSV